MSKEHPSAENSAGREYEVTEEEQRRFNHSEIRRAGKDLGIVIGQTPEQFPHRRRLFELAAEVLKLVPVYNAEDEARYEREQFRPQQPDSSR